MALSRFVESSADQALVLDDSILLGDETPPLKDLRKSLSDELFREVQLLAQGRQAPNILLYGSPGYGKTTLAKRVLDDLTANTAVKCVYADCWRHYTRMAIYSLLAKKLELVLPRRGLATDEIFDRIIEVLDKTRQHLVIVLDEVEGLIFNHQQRLLFDLANANKSKPRFSFIAICDDALGFTELDERLKASLRLFEFKIKPFNAQELTEIITSKAEKALAPSSYTKIVIQACVKRASLLQGNAKAGLELLWRAALHAEFKGKAQISLADVKECEKAHLFAVPRSAKAASNEAERFNLEERLIVDLLEPGAITSTRLYAEFQGRLSRTKRQIRNYLSRLIEMDVVQASEQSNSASFFKSKLYGLVHCA